MGARIPAAALTLALLTGCSTNLQRLELTRDHLLEVERSADRIGALAAEGRFDPQRYDLYLLLNARVFDQILGGFDNVTLAVEGDRPIDITLSSVRLAFRPGYPDLTVAASAVDRRSGVRAEVDMDLRLIVEGDPAVPNTLYLKPVATRIVPRLRWGLLDFTRWRFARRLMELQAARLTERIPKIAIPVRSEFVIGGPGGTNVVQIPTGAGYIEGNVIYPSTEKRAAISVGQVLFLKNGVHVFANVGDL